MMMSNTGGDGGKRKGGQDTKDSKDDKGDGGKGLLKRKRQQSANDDGGADGEDITAKTVGKRLSLIRFSNDEDDKSSELNKPANTKTKTSSKNVKRGWNWSSGNSDSDFEKFYKTKSQREKQQKDLKEKQALKEQQVLAEQQTSSHNNNVEEKPKASKESKQVENDKDSPSMIKAKTDDTDVKKKKDGNGNAKSRRPINKEKQEFKRKRSRKLNKLPKKPQDKDKDETSSSITGSPIIKKKKDENTPAPLTPPSQQSPSIGGATMDENIHSTQQNPLPPLQLPTSSSVPVPARGGAVVPPPLSSSVRKGRIHSRRPKQKVLDIEAHERQLPGGSGDQKDDIEWVEVTGKVKEVRRNLASPFHKSSCLVQDKHVFIPPHHKTVANLDRQYVCSSMRTTQCPSILRWETVSIQPPPENGKDGIPIIEKKWFMSPHADHDGCVKYQYDTLYARYDKNYCAWIQEDGNLLDIAGYIYAPKLDKNYKHEEGGPTGWNCPTRCCKIKLRTSSEPFVELFVKRDESTLEFNLEKIKHNHEPIKSNYIAALKRHEEMKNEQAKHITKDKVNGEGEGEKVKDERKRLPVALTDRPEVLNQFPQVVSRDNTRLSTLMDELSYLYKIAVQRTLQHQKRTEFKCIHYRCRGRMRLEINEDGTCTWTRFPHVAVAELSFKGTAIKLECREAGQRVYVPIRSGKVMKVEVVGDISRIGKTRAKDDTKYKYILSPDENPPKPYVETHVQRYRWTYICVTFGCYSKLRKLQSYTHPIWERLHERCVGGGPLLPKAHNCMGVKKTRGEYVETGDTENVVYEHIDLNTGLVKLKTQPLCGIEGEDDDYLASKVKRMVNSGHQHVTMESDDEDDGGQDQYASNCSMEKMKCTIDDKNVQVLKRTYPKANESFMQLLDSQPDIFKNKNSNDQFNQGENESDKKSEPKLDFSIGNAARLVDLTYGYNKKKAPGRRQEFWESFIRDCKKKNILLAEQKLERYVEKRLPCSSIPGYEYVIGWYVGPGEEYETLIVFRDDCDSRLKCAHMECDMVATTRVTGFCTKHHKNMAFSIAVSTSVMNAVNAQQQNDQNMQDELRQVKNMQDELRQVNDEGYGDFNGTKSRNLYIAGRTRSLAERKDFNLPDEQIIKVMRWKLPQRIGIWMEEVEEVKQVTKLLKKEGDSDKKIQSRTRLAYRKYAPIQIAAFMSCSLRMENTQFIRKELMIDDLGIGLMELLWVNGIEYRLLTKKEYIESRKSKYGEETAKTNWKLILKLAKMDIHNKKSDGECEKNSFTRWCNKCDPYGLAAPHVYFAAFKSDTTKLQEWYIGLSPTGGLEYLSGVHKYAHFDPTRLGKKFRETGLTAHTLQPSQVNYLMAVESPDRGPIAESIAILGFLLVQARFPQLYKLLNAKLPVPRKYNIEDLKDLRSFLLRTFDLFLELEVRPKASDEPNFLIDSKEMELTWEKAIELASASNHDDDDVDDDDDDQNNDNDDKQDQEKQQHKHKHDTVETAGGCDKGGGDKGGGDKGGGTKKSSNVDDFDENDPEYDVMHDSIFDNS